MRTLQHSLFGVLCALVAAVGACKEEGPTTLFEEQGAWSLIEYDIDGSGNQAIDESRVDQFLLYFDQEAGIVAAASCVDSMGRNDVDASLCDTDEFECRCFNYTYEESTMIWKEFTTDSSTPPPPPENEDTVATPVGDPFSISLTAYPGSSGTFRYSGLPYELFNSQEGLSKYVFQIRGDGKFIPTGCLEICGATSPELTPAEM